jgi:hypothetical protein
MFHCEKCGKSLPIEFEGGARQTQIGDVNVIQQTSLNEQMMPADYDLERQGYYFHSVALCGDCLEPTIGKDVVIFKEDHEDPIETLLYYSNSGRAKEVAERIEEIAENCVQEFILDLDLERLQAINPDAYAETIGQKRFRLTAYKTMLSKEYLEKNQDELDKQFNDYVKESKDYQKLENEYITMVSPYEQECSKLLKEGAKKCFVELNLNSEVNLNHSIIFETTVRKRILPEQAFSLYKGPFEIPSDAIQLILSKNLWQRIMKSEVPARDKLHRRMEERIASL